MTNSRHNLVNSVIVIMCKKFGELRLLALGAGVLFNMMLGSAQAQIFDPVHMAANLGEQAASTKEQMIEWGRQHGRDAKRLAQLYTEYQSTLNKVSNLKSSIDVAPGVTLEEVDENKYMVEETCGKPYGGGAAGVIGQLTKIDLSGKIFQEQYKICSTTQKMRNRKFNEMVVYLTTTMDSVKTMQNEWNNTYSGLQDSGDVEGSISSGLSASRKLDAATSEFESRMRAYDTYIAAQKKAQSSLAKGAIRGKAGELRAVTDAAVMRAALCAGGRCN